MATAMRGSVSGCWSTGGGLGPSAAALVGASHRAPRSSCRRAAPRPHPCACRLRRPLRARGAAGAWHPGPFAGRRRAVLPELWEKESPSKNPAVCSQFQHTYTSEVCSLRFIFSVQLFYWNPALHY